MNETERKGRVAVLGDKDSVLAFSAVGLEVFGASTAEAAKDILRSLTKGGYAVIFITEDIASELSATLEMLKERTFPAIIPIPSSNQKGKGYGIKSIRKDVEKAIGADILFRD
jgi:V/A-type H+-transporting ATPase subunit F